MFEGSELPEWLTESLLKRALVISGLIFTPIIVLYISWILAGPLATIRYAFAFLLSFGFAPALIGIMGKATPMNGSLGKGHFVLGSFAAGHPYLIQLKDRYEIVPGTEDKYWLDGEWIDIDDGLTNKTVLGWRPFGFIWDKQDDSLEGKRTDAAAVADGGTSDVVRAGKREKAPPATISGMDGIWSVDLKRLYRSGLQRVGNIDLVETAEEQTMRDEVGSSMVDKWSTMLGGMVGLVIGVVIGYVYLMGGA